VDPDSAYSSIPMTDDGAAGDVVANDGVYSGLIPAQTDGSMVAFYLEASDKSIPSGASRFPANAPIRDCLLRVAEPQPTATFPLYSVWMMQATLNTWDQRNKLDNTPLDITFVADDDRAIYNATALYAGSPYIAPGYCGATCGACGYSLIMPADDLFLGEQDLVLDWAGGHGGETSALQEQM